MKEAGVLLHISSLPGKYGVGSLGQCAYDFVDFLSASGQKIWQILPLGPTSFGDSPYSSTSAFAYNPYFIDLDLLVKDKLIEKEDLPEPFLANRVNYNYLKETRFPILHKAFLNYKLYEKEFDEYCKKNDYWLDDYAMFMTIKEWMDDKPWSEWYDNERTRRAESLKWLKEDFRPERVKEFKFYNFLFYYL